MKSLVVTIHPALIDAYPGVGGIAIRDVEIIAWPSDVPLPTQIEIDTLEADWPLKVKSMEARKARDDLLTANVDPIATNPFRWASLSATQQKALEQYRVALLDVPQQPGFPSNIVWPVAP